METLSDAVSKLENAVPVPGTGRTTYPAFQGVPEAAIEEFVQPSAEAEKTCDVARAIALANLYISISAISVASTDAVDI